MYFYAEQSPRGFANEINTFAFTSRVNRDKWVAKHENDGDVNSASQGARSITRKQALRNTGSRGKRNGWGEESYNSAMIDGDHEIATNGEDYHRYL